MTQDTSAEENQNYEASKASIYESFQKLNESFGKINELIQDMKDEGIKILRRAQELENDLLKNKVLAKELLELLTKSGVKEDRIVHHNTKSKGNIITDFSHLPIVSDPDQIEKFLDKPIEAVDELISIRTYNALKAAKISNFRQLIEWDVTVKELLKYRNTGKKTIMQIKSLLAVYGLKDKRRVE